MVKARKVRKTRPQKKSFIVAIIASVLTLGFGVGVLVSGLNYPDAHDIDNIYEGNALYTISKLQDNGYIVGATSKDKDGKLDNAYLYLYDEHDDLKQKVSIFNDVEEEFAITDLASFDGFYSIFNNDSLYAVSGKYLFHYSGLNEYNLTLEGYTDNFLGRIVQVAADEDDLWVISQIGSQYRVDRFDPNDDAFNIKSSGYIYEVNNRGDNYSLVCSKNMFIYSVEAIGDYLYVSTNTYIRRIHKDMKNNNYRILYEQELETVKANNPDLSVKEQQELAKSNCMTTYGWLDYDYGVHTILLDKNSVSPSNFAFYRLPEMCGVFRYQDKYYFADKSDLFYTYGVDELNDSPMMINLLEDELHRIKTINFKKKVRQEVSVSCFCYYKTGNTAIIFHEESSSLISILDLTKDEILYTADISLRIHDALYNDEKGTLIYKFTDPVNRQSGVNYLSTCSVKKMLTISYIKPILITFIVLTTIALITSIIAWLCYGFKGVMIYVIKTAKGLKRFWPIYIILFPSVFILCLFCYYPGIAAIYTSFFDYKAGISDIKTWNNFANYIEIFGNANSLRHFGNMVLFLVADVVLAIVPPLIFAYFLTLMRSKKISGVLRTLLFIPGIIPGIASLLIWRTGIYGDYGLINLIVKSTGGDPILFFRSDDYLNMLWLILMGFPFVGSYLIFYGAMMNIPSSYYEAAELDGISVFKRFVKIDIPLCFPQIKYVLIMCIIASIQNFSRVYVTMGRTQNVVSTPIVEMYMLMNGSERNYGLASAYATILFVILFGLTYLSMRNRIKEK